MDFSVRYDTIASTDVIHFGIVVPTGSFLYHSRAIISGTTITWAAATDIGPNGLTTNNGFTITLDLNHVPIDSDSSNFSSDARVAANADLGTSWVDAWDSIITVDSLTNTPRSTALIPLTSTTTLRINDNAAGNNFFTRLRYSLGTVGGVNGYTWAAENQATNVITAAQEADWGWAVLNDGSVHIVLREGTNSVTDYKYSSGAFDAGTAITTAISIAIDTGIALATDGTNMWAFAISSAAGNDIYYNRWSHVTGWGGWTALGLSSATRNRVGCYQTVVGGVVALYWTEGTSPYNLMAYSFSATAAPEPPTGIMAMPASTGATVQWTAPTYTGYTAITGYTVTASPGGATATTTGATSAYIGSQTNGTTYTFTVHATNSVGNSAESSSSPSCTPYRYLDGQVLGAGFSGRIWGGADAGSPTGYIYGFVGGDASAFVDIWRKKGQYALGSLETTVHRPNPPFNFLSPATPTQTGIASVEAKAELLQTRIVLLEARLSILQSSRISSLEAQLRILQSSRVSSLEAQLRAIQTGVEQIEAQLRLIPTASVPLEAKLLLDLMAVARLEAGLGVSQAPVSPLEARATFAQTGLAALENQLAASATRLLILEAQARLSASPALPLEAKLGLITTAQALLEALLGIAPSGVLSLESDRVTISVSETAVLLLESLLMLAITAISSVESKTPVVQASVTRTEANNTTALLEALPLEAQLAVLRTASGSLESLLLQAITAEIDVEAKAALVQALLTRVEATGIFQRTSALSVELQRLVARTSLSSLEALHRQIISGATGLEANLTATQQALGALESLLALVRLQLLRVEFTRPLTGSRVLELENTLAMTPQVLNLDLEALYRLLGLAATRMEARGTVLRSRDVSLESLLAQIATALAGLESWRAVSPSPSASLSLEAPGRLLRPASLPLAAYGRLTSPRTLVVEWLSPYIHKDQVLELDALARIFRVLPGQAAIIPLETIQAALRAIALLLEVRGYTAAALGGIPLESRHVFKNASAFGDLIILQRPFTPGVDL